MTSIPLAGHDFQTTLEQAPVGISHNGLDGRWLWVNAYLCQMLGYSHDELTRLTLHEITHPDDLAPDLALGQRMLSGDIDHYTLEKRYIRKDGTMVWAQLMVSLVHDATGEPVYFIGAVQDISRRKAAEEALQASEYRFRRLFERSLDAMVLINDAGRYLDINQAAADLIGYPRDQLLTMNVTDILGRSLEEVEEQFQEYAKAPGQRGQFWFTRPDGNRRIAEYHAVELEPGEHLAIMHDITERERAQTALRETERMAAIGNLAAGIAHDMANLIVPMRIGTTLLENFVHGREPKAALSIVERSVIALTDLTASLRHVVQGDPCAEPMRVSLPDWWNQAQPLLQAAMPAGVRLAQSFEPRLPKITVNEGLFMRAILNLVTNATEALAASGQCDGLITVSATQEAGHLLVSVSDNGPGMPPEVIEHVFEPFFSTKSADRASGLGMTSVRQFATEAGGAVFIQSAPGEGTTVTLKLRATADYMH